jgi:hypothetical protein
MAAIASSRFRTSTRANSRTRQSWTRRTRRASSTLKEHQAAADATLRDRALKVHGAKAALDFENAERERMAKLLNERSRAQRPKSRRPNSTTITASLAHGRDHAHERNMMADGVLAETLKNLFNPPPPPKPAGAGASAK